MKLNRKVDVQILIEKFTKSSTQSEKFRALSKLITLVENDSALTAQVISRINQDKVTSLKSHVIGITGLPGSGKSTLISLLIKEFREKNETVALFAVDPSAHNQGGAILGNRIRMQDHFSDEA